MSGIGLLGLVVGGSLGGCGIGSRVGSVGGVFDELGEAVGQEEVVPFVELLDVAVADAEAVVVGHDFAERLVKLLGIHRVAVNGLTTGLVVKHLHDLAKRGVAAFGVHRDVAQRYHLVARMNGETTLGLYILNYQGAAPLAQYLLQSGLARDRNDFL